ncbi:MAG: hypothetical protein ACI9TP_000981, partial [Candidatus Azotimanducaceae bacterium]
CLHDKYPDGVVWLLAGASAGVLTGS